LYALEVRWSVLLIACGAAPPPPPAHHVDAPPAYRFRKLAAGAIRTDASRTTFALTIAGTQATLVETHETSPARSVREATDATWTMTSTRTYRGTASDGATQLHLTSDGVQPLELRCAKRVISAAQAGAGRVPSPGFTGECGDVGTWDPPELRTVQVLACGEGDPDDTDNDEALLFAPAPGIEYALEHDACLRGAGLRLAR
jgi:hypothetical protein